MHPPAAHLTYCTNVHPGETWPEVRTVLAGPVLAVKARVSPDAPFAVGLRLSAEAAAGLHPVHERVALRSWLDAHGLYVQTLNGFPYGRFHGAPVKADVYRPDWREPARVDYTATLADVLEGLLPPGIPGNISTVPGCFRRFGDPAATDVIARNLARLGAVLWRKEQLRGVEIVLAIEPEPACLLETTEEAADFLESHVYRGTGLEGLMASTGLDRSAAEIALRRHIGVCLDVCHAAVEFEDPGQCVDALVARGIRIAKVQISAGLRVRPVDAERIEALASFDDPVYLHQVVARGASGLVRFDDLGAAITEWKAGKSHAEEWRVHFHVPVFMARQGPFECTQDFTRAVLAAIRRTGACDCLEVETYTWSVLPAAPRRETLDEAIATELLWARTEWDACG